MFNKKKRANKILNKQKKKSDVRKSLDYINDTLKGYNGNPEFKFGLYAILRDNAIAVNHIVDEFQVKPQSQLETIDQLKEPEYTTITIPEKKELNIDPSQITHTFNLPFNTETNEWYLKLTNINLPMQNEMTITMKHINLVLTPGKIHVIDIDKRLKYKIDTLMNKVVSVSYI